MRAGGRRRAGARLAAPAGAGLLEPRGKKVWFGISDTGDPADFGPFSERVDKHPAVIESFRTWGSDFPESIQRWQTARARPVIHITTADNNDGHEIITPRAIAAGRRRRVPDPAQPALLREGDARLRAAAGRAQPLPQRLRRLRLRRRRPRPGSHTALVQARLPPHLRDRPRRRQGEGDQPAPGRSRAAATQRQPRRPAEGTGRDRLEPTALGLADRAPEPAAPLLAGLALGRLDRAPTSTPPIPNGNRSPASTTATRTSPSRSPSGESKPATTRPSSASCSPGSRQHPRCKMLVYYQDFGDTSNYRIQNYPSSLSVLQRPPSLRPFPGLRAGCAALPPPPPGAPPLRPLRRRALAPA